MGFMDKIKDFISVQDDGVYDDDFDTDYGETSSSYSVDDTQSDDRDIYSGRDDYSPKESSFSRRTEYRSSRQSESRSDTKRNKYVNIQATTQLKVVLVKPESMEEASSIADHLTKRHTVVLNLESTNKDIARRLVDFLSGAAYANQGNIKRVASNTFIITPFNVDIMGDLPLEELEQSDLYM